MNEDMVRKLEAAKVGDLVLICFGDDLNGAWIGEFNGKVPLKKLISGEKPGIEIKYPARSLERIRVGSLELPSWGTVATNGTDLTKGEYANPATALTRVKEFYVGAEEIGKRIEKDPFYGGLAQYFTGKS